MGIQTWPAPKDPDETKDYVFRFGPVLAGETISDILSCEVTVGSVEIVGSPTIVTDTEYGASANVKVRLSGGVIDEPCEVRALVEAPSGQTSDLTGKLKIRKK